MPARVIDRLDQLAEVGGLDVRDPGLAAAARQRSFVAPTGITHTLSDVWGYDHGGGY